jgi:cyclase
MRHALLAAACCLAAVLVFAQQDDFSKVQIKTTKVAGSVYMLQGAGGNIAVSVGGDGIVMVDDEFAPLAPKISEALKDISPKPVRFIINTHYHGDHTGANAEFAASGSTILAQDNVRRRLAEGTTTLGRKNLPASGDALPIITFNDRATVWLNGEEVRAIHFPHGHTDGDSVIWFTQSNVVHMGDDFVTYGFPFVDVQNGGSVSGMIAGDEKVLAMVPADARFIPGHGPLSTGDDVRKFIQLLRDTRAAVLTEVKQGKTLEQIKAAKPLAQWDEKYGRGFIKTDEWIDALYDDITHSEEGAHYINHGHAEEKPRQ